MLDRFSGASGATQPAGGARAWSGDQVLAPALIVAALLSVDRLAFAADAPSPGEGADERAAVHAQLTYVEQEAGGFASPYAGPNSLSPDQGRETFDATLYVGTRLWSGAEAWLNGEVDQGFGLNGTLGVAGFPSGEAYKVGRKRPYLRLPRAFVRQVWDLGGEERSVAPDQNQLGGHRSDDRLVLTIGKFGVGDVFDTISYAHDPRADFLNWSALDAATFDYSADAWGYTIGAALEYYVGDWTARAAFFDLSDVPNSPHLDPGAHEFQLVAEIEHRHELRGLPGRLLVTTYDSRARMGLLEDALARGAAGEPVDTAAVRRYRSRTGAHLSLEQAVTDDLGLFARAGGASGNVEVYEFTDVDRTVTLGASLHGTRWGRAADTVAVDYLVNEASALRQRYLAAGGLGILVGDGQLPHPGREQIIEGYYSAAIGDHVHLTLDYQRVVNPAFNRDRGPVPIFAFRLHAQF